jgi:hypothetical protein
VVSQDQPGGIIRLGNAKGAGLSQPWKPCRHRRSLRDRDTAFQQGIRGTLFDAARCNSPGGRLRRAARQGSRRD